MATAIDDVLSEIVSRLQVKAWCVTVREIMDEGVELMSIHGPFDDAQEAFDWAASQRDEPKVLAMVYPLIRPEPA